MSEKPVTGRFHWSQPFSDASVGNFVISVENWLKDNEGCEILIQMNSGGGDVHAALTLYNYFLDWRQRSHKVTVKVMGRAASCTAWVIQAASHRIMCEEAELMIHQVQTGVNGPTPGEFVNREAARTAALNAKNNRILCQRATGLTPKLVKRRTRGGRDWWLSAQQALEFDLIDDIETFQLS